MSRSYLISAEQALKETQGDYDQQIDRLNNLIKEAAELGNRSIIIPSSMIELDMYGLDFKISNLKVAKEVSSKGFILANGELCW